MVRTLHLGTGTDFLIIESPEGVTPPPLPGYRYIGDTSGIFTMLNYHLKQADIANLVGVKQQHVSSIAQGNWEPRINENRWRTLLAALRHHCIDQPDHKHDLALYRANILSPAHKGKKKPRKSSAPAETPTPATTN
jgi:hypothetical protein